MSDLLCHVQFFDHTCNFDCVLRRHECLETDFFWSCRFETRRDGVCHVKESLDLIGYKIVASRKIAQDRHVFQFIAEPVHLHVISSEAVARDKTISLAN